MLTDILARLFRYHRPWGTQPSRYASLREAARVHAETIAALTPSSPEQTLAIRAVHLASMHANSAIAVNEPEPEGDPAPGYTPGNAIEGAAHPLQGLGTPGAPWRPTPGCTCERCTAARMADQVPLAGKIGESSPEEVATILGKDAARVADQLIGKVAATQQGPPQPPAPVVSIPTRWEVAHELLNYDVDLAWLGTMAQPHTPVGDVQREIGRMRERVRALRDRLAVETRAAGPLPDGPDALTAQKAPPQLKVTPPQIWRACATCSRPGLTIHHRETDECPREAVRYGKASGEYVLVPLASWEAAASTRAAWLINRSRALARTLRGDVDRDPLVRPRREQGTNPFRP